MCKQLLLYLMQKTSVCTPFRLYRMFFCCWSFYVRTYLKRLLNSIDGQNGKEKKKRTKIEWPEIWNIAQSLFKNICNLNFTFQFVLFLHEKNYFWAINSPKNVNLTHLSHLKVLNWSKVHHFIHKFWPLILHLTSTQTRVKKDYTLTWHFKVLFDFRIFALVPAGELLMNTNNNQFSQTHIFFITLFLSIGWVIFLSTSSSFMTHLGSSSVFVSVH